MTRNCLRCNASFDVQSPMSVRKYCLECISLISVESGKKRKTYKNKTPKVEYITDSKKKTQHGYVEVLVDGVWILEHRYVMSQILGRPLVAGESVHHKNGIRDENSAENLELWVGPIRYGQRASDIKCHNCGESYKIK